MKNLIPHFIYDKYKKNENKGEFNAITMFMDISGFTEITEKLMDKGKEGAEELSVIINTIFIPLINTIYEKKGFISSFEGDAITIIFITNDPINNLSNVFYTALNIQKLFRSIGIQETAHFGQFIISAKIGLSYGKIEWGILGNEKHKTYFFNGEAIEGAANSEHQCKKGEIIFDKNLYLPEFIEKKYFDIKKLKHNYYKLNSINYENSALLRELVGKESKIDINQININQIEILSLFLPNKVIYHKQVGEFREIASVFISLKTIKSFEELNKIICNMLYHSDSFGGYFEGLNFGDKGCNILILFGAPITYENNIERAINFIQEIKKELNNNFRIGVSFGTVYSGLRGSQIRCSYGVLGNIVNLSARFMMKANWGDIWISDIVAKTIKNKYKINFIGKHHFKGKANPIEVYKMEGEKQQKSEDNLFETKMFGRTKELDEIMMYCNGILDNKFGGIVYVYGEAGIGKSRLIYELRKKLDPRLKIFIMHTDAMLKRSLNPFNYFLNHYFEQISIQKYEKKKEKFEEIYNNLIERLKNMYNYNQQNNEEIYNIIRELERTKSLIGSILGLHWENSLYENLSARARYENTIYAIKEFFKAESIINPIVLIIEDINNLDEDSNNIFGTITHNIGNYPIIIIATSRFNDDGTEPKLRVAEEIKSNKILLSELPENSIDEFIKFQFDSNVNKNLIEFITTKSKGNPFYLEQFCLYLSENNLLEFDNENMLKLKKTEIKLPNTVNSFLISRVDRLSPQLKEIAQIASILGNEFDLPVFYEMIKIFKKLIKYLNFVIKDEFQMWALTTILKKENPKHLLNEGEKERLWYAENKNKYNFKHTLLREVIYEMQSRKRLQNLHRIAGEAIEKIFKDDETKYAELAYHYEKAEVYEEAKNYLFKASEWASLNYNNQEALSLYNRLIKYSYNKAEEIEILYKKAKILDLIGEWKIATDILNKGIELSKEIKDNKKEAGLKVLYGKILQESSQYNKALNILNSAKTISEEINDKKSLTYCLDNIGEIYRLKGDYNTAMLNFQKSLIIGSEIGDKIGASDSLNNIGNIYRHKQNYDKALKCHYKSIQIKKEIGDKDGISLAYNNISIIFWNKSNYDKALKFVKKSLKIKEEMGNKRGKSISYNGIGIIYRDKGEYDKALKFHLKSLKINEEMGDKRGISMCAEDIGIIYSNKENYKKAIKYYNKSINIKNEIGAKGELGKAYSHLAYAYLKLGKYKQSINIAYLNFKNIQEIESDVEHGKTYLIVAMVLDYYINNKRTIPIKDRKIKKLIEKITIITKLDKDPEIYFEKAIESAINFNFLNTLVPTLYEYGKYLYKKGIKELGINKIKEAKDRALSHNMKGEIEKIKKVCEELDILALV